MTQGVVNGRERLNPLTIAEAALADVPAALPELVCVGDEIDTESQEGFLRQEALHMSQSKHMILHLRTCV